MNITTDKFYEFLETFNQSAVYDKYYFCIFNSCRESQASGDYPSLYNLC